MLRILTPVKIQRLRLGLNPQTWVPEASMLTTRPPKPSTAKDNSDTGSKPYDCLFVENDVVYNGEFDLCLTVHHQCR